MDEMSDMDEIVVESAVAVFVRAVEEGRFEAASQALAIFFGIARLAGRLAEADSSP